MSESVDSPTGWLPDPSSEDFFQNIICVALQEAFAPYS